MARMVFGRVANEISARRLRGMVVHARDATRPAHTLCTRPIGRGTYALTVTLGRNIARINCAQCMPRIGRPLIEVLAD